jgi:hypothetical protein
LAISARNRYASTEGEGEMTDQPDSPLDSDTFSLGVA